MLAGNVRVAGTSFHAFEEKARHKVTKADGRKLLELDGKPVAEVYGRDVFALPRGMRGVTVNRQYPFGRVEGTKTKVLYQGRLGEDGAYEFEIPIETGSELLIMERGKKPLSECAQEAATKVEAELGQCALMLVAGDIFAWDSYAAQCDLLKAVWGQLGAGGQLINRFGQGELASLDGVRSLTGYIVRIGK